MNTSLKMNLRSPIPIQCNNRPRVGIGLRGAPQTDARASFSSSLSPPSVQPPRATLDTRNARRCGFGPSCPRCPPCWGKLLLFDLWRGDTVLGREEGACCEFSLAILNFGWTGWTGWIGIRKSGTSCVQPPDPRLDARGRGWTRYPIRCNGLGAIALGPDRLWVARADSE